MLIMDGRVFDRLEELRKIIVEAKDTLSISQKAWQYGIEKGIDIEQHRSWFPILPRRDILYKAMSLLQTKRHNLADIGSRPRLWTQSRQIKERRCRLYPKREKASSMLNIANVDVGL